LNINASTTVQKLSEIEQSAAELLTI